MNCSHCEHKSYYVIDCNKCIPLGYKLMVNTSAKQAQPCSQSSLLPIPTGREPRNEVEAGGGPAR